MADVERLHRVLEQLYERDNRFSLIGNDPLGFLYRYPNDPDREIVGLISALLAYGRVRQIGSSIERLLEILGPKPYEYIRGTGSRKKDRALLKFRHRFTSGRDIWALFAVLNRIYQSHPDLESYFMAGFQGQPVNMIDPLSMFSEGMYAMYRELFGRDPDRGFCYLVSTPRKNSVCKRLMLFLRWMVRKDAVDPGLWSRIDPRLLIVPLDTHMIRITSLLGLHAAKTVNLKTAAGVTARFAALCPQDPVKYDFALSRIGIVEQCTGKENDYCPHCALGGFCRNRM